MMAHDAKMANFRCPYSMTPDGQKGQIPGGSTSENKLQGM